MRTADLSVKQSHRKRAPALQQIKQNWGLYLLLLPAVILLLLFAYIPMYGIVIAFKDYSPALGIGGSPWAGLKYFEKFFNSYQFDTTIKNTLILSLYSLATFPIPIMLALMINQMRENRFKRFFSDRNLYAAFHLDRRYGGITTDPLIAQHRSDRTHLPFVWCGGP